MEAVKDVLGGLVCDGERTGFGILSVFCSCDSQL